MVGSVVGFVRVVLRRRTRGEIKTAIMRGET
jgi:hypothetical protein